METVRAANLFKIMSGRAPGSIVQMIHFAVRCRDFSEGGVFVEYGAGNGDLAAILLERGWSGEIFETDSQTAAGLSVRFQSYVRLGTLKIHSADFVDNTVASGSVDFVYSSMVLEHLPLGHVKSIIIESVRIMRPGGRLSVYVPASPDHWSIE
ncbi:class I SAM-dependent methyltransferase, partial [Pontimonas sp.]|nr:class I SAM-dependent methyltransferase [Pontimonas sp.]